MRAIFFAIATVLLWGMAPLFEKVALKGIDVAPAVCLRSFAVSTMLLGYLAVTRGFGKLSGFPWYVYLLIVLGGTCGSLIGQVTFFKALKSDQASLVVPFVATFPMVTTIGALLFLGESLTPRKAAGIVCAIMGAYLLSSVGQPPPKAHAAPEPTARVGSVSECARSGHECLPDGEESSWKTENCSSGFAS